MKSLGVIAARGGSKGVPRKNLSRLGDIPLMEFTRRAAAGSRLDRVIVSTDDPEISALAESIGLEVPFVRPSEISGDDASTISAIRHAVDQVESGGESYDIVVSLDITAPFKLAADIDECLSRFEQGATSVNAVCEAEINPYFNMLKVGEDGWATPLFKEFFTLTRRQDAPVVYRENGILQAVTVERLKAGHWPVTDLCSLLIVPASRSVMIDQPNDLVIAEILAAEFLSTYYPNG